MKDTVTIVTGGAQGIGRSIAEFLASRGGDIAIFRNDQDEIFAIHDKCPHKGGPLSQGIVFGRTVACPLHSWQIDLATGEALAPDHGCAGRFELKVEQGEVYLAL